MTMPLGRTLATLTVAAGLSLATAGAAGAQTLTVRDQAGDVESMSMDSATTTAEPGVTNGDIVRTVLRHGTGRISARLKFTDIRRVGSVSNHFLRVVTNEGITRDVNLYAGPQHWRGEAEMTRPNGRTVPCGIRHSIDYDLDVVTVSFPRSCVSSPRWVRVGVGSTWAKQDLSKFYVDDAQISGHLNPDGLRLSARLHRG